ncbi:hypothetical protein TNCV_442541 [Trichonephila clavipes]|nr:hypothetical protein TNCV_442541 [Trichonephila clavipes]
MELFHGDFVVVHQDLSTHFRIHFQCDDAMPVQVEYRFPVTRTPQGIFCIIPHHLNDTDYTHRTQHASIDAFHNLQLTPSIKIESLLVVLSYLPAYSVVDDNLCDHLLFDVKPHCRYETSNVAPVSISLPIEVPPYTQLRAGTLCLM